MLKRLCYLLVLTFQEEVKELCYASLDIPARAYNAKPKKQRTENSDFSTYSAVRTHQVWTLSEWNEQWNVVLKSYRPCSYCRLHSIYRSKVEMILTLLSQSDITSFIVALKSWNNFILVVVNYWFILTWHDFLFVVTSRQKWCLRLHQEYLECYCISQHLYTIHWHE